MATGPARAQPPRCQQLSHPVCHSPSPRGAARTVTRPLQLRAGSPSVWLDTWVTTCEHPCGLTARFCHPKNLRSSDRSPPAAPNPWRPPVCSCLRRLAFSRMSCSWNDPLAFSDRLLSLEPCIQRFLPVFLWLNSASLFSAVWMHRSLSLTH